MSRSSASPPQAVEVTSLRRPEPAAHEKSMGSSSRSVARPIREDQWVTRSRTAPGGSSASEVRRDPPRRVDPPRRPEQQEPSPRHLFDGSDRTDTDSMQRRLSWARSTSSASTLSAPQEADSGATPRCLKSLIIWRCEAPNVQVSLC
jgi:hypothetical protein